MTDSSRFGGPVAEHAPSERAEDQFLLTWPKGTEQQLMVSISCRCGDADCSWTGVLNRNGTGSWANTKHWQLSGF